MQQKWLSWLILLGTAGCGGAGTTENNGNNNGGNYPGDPGGTPAQSATVDVLDNNFSPNAVVVAVGGTVTFHWVGTNGHSVTPSGATFSPTAGVSFPPKDMTVTFSAAGTYNYYCIIHGASDGYGGQGNMIGTITVR